MKENTYFSPYLYTAILENFFDCKIYVFNDDEIQAPKFIQNHVFSSAVKEKKTIFILEHMGTKSDRFPYPRCELIYETFESRNQVIFDYKTSKYPKFILGLFIMSNNSSSVIKQTSTYDFEDFFFTEGYIQYQLINAYGKASAFLLKTPDDKYICLFSDTPMPPISVESIHSGLKSYMTYPEKENHYLLEFINHFFNIKKVDHSYFEVESKECGNVYKIPFRSPNIDQIPFENQPSHLVQFVENQQIAYALQEFAKYKFSYYLFMKEDKTGEITEKDIFDFMTANMMRQDDFTYTLDSIPSAFQYQEYGFVKKNKLIIKGLELMRRIAYLLYIERYNIQDYNPSKVFQKLYIDPLDFTQSLKQTVLKGDLQFFQSFLKKSNVYHKFFRNIRLPDTDRTSTPYILNPLLPKNGPYLAVTVCSDIAAQSLLYFWNKYKIVSVKEIEPDQENPYDDVDVYAMRSSNQIELVREGRSLQQNKIINYDNRYLAVLLKV
jgi:hypothetical protein